jgi:hypothetical protein
MSEQALSLDNWEEVKQVFRDHFKPESVEVNNDTIKYSKGSEFLKVGKDGEVSGAMPLHETSLSGVKEIVFRDSEIEFKSGKESYVFRR